jgi:phosphatidylcholine synthase
MTSGHGQSGEPIAIREVPSWRRLLAWCVHAYTALGLVIAASMAVLIVRGDDAALRASFALMFLATVIDATDGILARAVRVRDVLPGFDGRQLDYLTDFLTYVVLPLLLVWRAGILPDGWNACLIAPLVAGAYWFCQVEAKTSDGYFLGFPACWNVVALYLYVLHRQVVALPGWFSIGVLLVLSVLTFVPTRYLYGTMGGRLNLVANLLGLIWAGLLTWMVYRLPSGAGEGHGSDTWWPIVVWLSLLFPLAYFAVSWYVSWKLWRSRSGSESRDAPHADVALPADEAAADTRANP